MYRTVAQFRTWLDLLAQNSTWTGIQTFNDGKAVLAGLTSGNTTIKAAAVAGTGSATLPAGTSSIAAIDVKQTFTKQQTPLGATLTDAATVAWNCDTDGQVVQVTLAGNRTFGAPTNQVNRTFYSLTVIQDGTGSRTGAWNAVFKFTGASVPTLSTAIGSKDYFTFLSDGTNMFEQGRSLGVA